MSKPFALPSIYKEYLAKHAKINAQIKIYQCSKYFSQLILRYFTKQCEKLSIFYTFQYNYFECHQFKHIEIFYNHPYLTSNKPLMITNFFEFVYQQMENSQIRTLLTKLDLSQLKKISLSFLRVKGNSFKLFLSPSLKDIDISNCAVDEIDVPLTVFQKCPKATKIRLFRLTHIISSLESLSQIIGKRKLKEFEITNIVAVVTTDEVIEFIDKHGKIGSKFRFHGNPTLKFKFDTSKWMCLMNGKEFDKQINDTRNFTKIVEENVKPKFVTFSVDYY